jgi:alpha-tubulin suppressor-like RCC1 family protein
MTAHVLRFALAAAVLLFARPAAPAPLAATAVGASLYHSCALTTGGDVACWGRNYGQLGDGTTTDRLTPIRISGLPSPAIAIAGGGFHTCVLTHAGAAWCWGGSRTGDGTAETRTTPVPVLGLSSGVTSIDAGDFHTCAVTASGAAVCWGGNYLGQLGDGTKTDRLAPVPVSGLSSGITAVATGIWHSCALTSGGGVLCWGYNGVGQLGDASTVDSLTPVPVVGLSSGVVKLAAGAHYNCGLLNSGGVVCWGANYAGQLGDGTTTNRVVPVPVSGLSGGVVDIAGGYEQTCALTSAGAVLCWGDNPYGQLGDGTTLQRHTPVAVAGLSSGATAVATGPYQSCAVLGSGPVLCWGNNQYGQLGDGTIINRYTPVLVDPPVQRGIVGDFDGDGRADLPIWRASTGTWYWLTSSSGHTGAASVQWGNCALGDVPLSGDLDGDGATDLVIWRVSTGTWYWLTSTSGYTGAGSVQWGNQSLGDVPLLADMDGDRKDDLIVWRASTGTWYWLSSTSGYQSTAARAQQFGDQAQDDVPLLADIDGDRKADLVLWRASTGTWYWLTSSSGYDVVAGRQQWGNQSLDDVPRLGDLDGDGKADLVVWRASAGMWYWLTSSSNYDPLRAGQNQWGNQGQGDIPLLSDLDGDGKADLVAWRPTTGMWYWLPSSTGYNHANAMAKQWGNGSLGDIP